MRRTTEVAFLLTIVMATAVHAVEAQNGAKANITTPAADSATTIKSWKPLPGEQFEVAGRKAPVIRPERPAAGNPGRD